MMTLKLIVFLLVFPYFAAADCFLPGMLPLIHYCSQNWNWDICIKVESRLFYCLSLLYQGRMGPRKVGLILMKISQNDKTTDTVSNLSTASLSILSKLIEPISSDVSGDVMGCAIACSALDKDGDPSCGAFTTGHHKHCKFMPGPIGLETVDARQAVFLCFSK